MTPDPVRVRFAPSPTGYLHVGGARTALFNWLYARHTGGAFLLRVEDTDVERNRPELTQAIFDALEWLDLDWDEAVVYQSERFNEHRAAADQLESAGHAYWCDCTPEQVQARAKERGGPPGYDGYCRDRGLGPGPGRALRFRVPPGKAVSWDDRVRGAVSVERHTLEDFVLLRSSGTPTFLLANIVDDHAMGITHVIRGEEHINGTPKYLLLGEALGFDFHPVFAHAPVLVNEQRKKLSKRREDLWIADYQHHGYLPEAMCNYLALLGWGPPDGVEIRPLDEIVSLFRLDDINPSPAFFDPTKLSHVNGEYIRMLTASEFVERATPFLDDGTVARDALTRLAAEVRDRVRTLDEVNGMIDFLYLDEPVIDPASWDKAMVRGKTAPELLDGVIEGLAAIEDNAWTADAIRTVVEKATVELGYVNAEGRPQLAKTQGPIRVAVSGRMVGPPLFESLTVLGRERTLARLRAARSRLP